MLICFFFVFALDVVFGFVCAVAYAVAVLFAFACLFVCMLAVVHVILAN